MTSAALAWGCGLLAFSPTASILFLIAYQKAQLIIVVTTAAFAFLLSTLFASLFWLIFDAAGIDHALLTLLPGVVAQFFLRCGFVMLYHKVENVIQTSIERHEQQHPEDQGDLPESARLRLELNDWSCGVAAGCGFGGMHALLLYGTLLASEAGNVGTLYQDSCPNMPSLVLSALNAFFFSFLDFVWMLLTFYGLRRRLLFPAGITSSPLEMWNLHNYMYGGWGASVGNTRNGGNLVLAVTALSHVLASLFTTPNGFEDGCLLSLPLLGGITLAMVVFFWGGVSRIYLPEHQQRRSEDDELLREPIENSQHED